MNSLKSWASRCYRRRTEVRRGFGSGVRETLIYSAFAVGGSLAADSGERFDGRWRAYDYDNLINRDKASLDIFWLRDESLSDSDNLPERRGHQIQREQD